MTLWIDAEPDMFGISRMYEYCYQIGEWTWIWSSRVDECARDFEKLIDRLQEFAPDHLPVICLGHHSNFRYAVYPQYKANRVWVRKAPGYGAFREWIQEYYATLSFDNIEADDVIGLKAEPGDLIYSKDKDLKTIAGLHLEPDGTVLEVTEVEANRRLYKQILCGDTADNFKGCPGVGDKHKLFSQERWNKPNNTEEKFWELCLMEFAKSEKLMKKRGIEEAPFAHAITMARCARILRRGEYDFENKRPVLWRGPS